MKWIRWQGVLSFIGIIILVVVFGLFFADKIVHKIIETGGTKAVGAKVELASVDLKFSPLGLSLRGLKITNPDDPMKNAVDVGHINISLEAMNLFFSKITIQDLAATDVKFNTERIIIHTKNTNLLLLIAVLQSKYDHL